MKTLLDKKLSKEKSRVTPIGSTFEFRPEHLGTFRHYQKSLKNTFGLVLALTETRGRPFEVEISQY